MALVTYEYYSGTYLGEPVAEADFPRYDKRAETQIFVLTNLTETTAAELPEETLELLRMAVCAQVEYLWENGLEVAVSGSEGGGGFTVGKVSVKDGGSSASLSGARSSIAPAVFAYLERTGLLYPGVPTAGMPAQAWRWWP